MALQRPLSLSLSLSLSPEAKPKIPSSSSSSSSSYTFLTSYILLDPISLPLSSQKMGNLSTANDRAEAPLLQSPGSDDDVRAFRSFFRWMCLDQSSGYLAIISWLSFFVLAIAVPTASYSSLSYRPERQPYDLVVQLSLSAASTLSFLTLGSVTRHYGLRRFLFLDKLPAESNRVRASYLAELRRSFRLLALFVMPCFAAVVVYKLWWYSVSFGKVPFLGNRVAGYCITCVLDLTSWIYRTAIFFFVCVLFRLISHLHILRLQEFAAVFKEESEVGAVLKEHLRIKRQLKVISHRFRAFILLGIIMITASQLATLLVLLRPNSFDNLFNTGELALSSVVLVTGIFICLRSAVKTTHKAQALTSHAAKWHVCATIETFGVDPEMSFEVKPDSILFQTIRTEVAADYSEESTSEEDEDELEGTDILQPHINTISFQKRQALVTYLENNKLGITVYGLTVDRAWLQSIYTLEQMIFLWLLGKTVGVS